MSEVEIIIKIYVGLHFLRVTMEKWKEKKKRRKSDEEILKKTIQMIVTKLAIRE